MVLLPSVSRQALASCLGFCVCGNLSDVESMVIPLNSKQRGTGMLLFVAHCSHNTKAIAVLTSPFGSPCNTWLDFVAAVQLSIHWTKKDPQEPSRKQSTNRMRSTLYFMELYPFRSGRKGSPEGSSPTNRQCQMLQERPGYFGRVKIFIAGVYSSIGIPSCTRTEARLCFGFVCLYWLHAELHSIFSSVLYSLSPLQLQHVCSCKFARGNPWIWLNGVNQDTESASKFWTTWSLSCMVWIHHSGMLWLTGEAAFTVSCHRHCFSHLLTPLDNCRRKVFCKCSWHQPILHNVFPSHKSFRAINIRYCRWGFGPWCQIPCHRLWPRFHRFKRRLKP